MGTVKFEARIKYFDYGVASVELKMEFEADWDQLIRLSNRWILAPEIEARTAELIARAKSVGYTALFVTVDAPAIGNREDERRWRMQQPWTVTPSRALDLIRHWRWVSEARVS